jgi:hypothetical protein
VSSGPDQIQVKITIKLTVRGAELRIGDAEATALKPDPKANQENPRGNYVYAHLDASGKIFYVGKGTGRRAWSAERHPLWHRYVRTRLTGQYQVQILQDNLTTEESERVEAAWIDQTSDQIVNWQNVGRKTDFQALDRYHALRDANRALIVQAKSVEKTDLEQAVVMYLRAIDAIKGYASISYEEGLVAQLLREEADELGQYGELEALDRLTLCLVKLKRLDEAAKQVASYLALYRRDMERAAYRRIAKRIVPRS